MGYYSLPAALSHRGKLTCKLTCNDELPNGTLRITLRLTSPDDPRGAAERGLFTYCPKRTTLQSTSLPCRAPLHPAGRPYTAMQVCSICFVFQLPYIIKLEGIHLRIIIDYTLKFQWQQNTVNFQKLSLHCHSLSNSKDLSTTVEKDNFMFLERDH